MLRRLHGQNRGRHRGLLRRAGLPPRVPSCHSKRCRPHRHAANRGTRLPFGAVTPAGRIHHRGSNIGMRDLLYVYAPKKRISILSKIRFLRSSQNCATPCGCQWQTAERGTWSLFRRELHERKMVGVHAHLFRRRWHSMTKHLPRGVIVGEGIGQRTRTARGTCPLRELGISPRPEMRIVRIGGGQTTWRCPAGGTR